MTSRASGVRLSPSAPELPLPSRTRLRPVRPDPLDREERLRNAADRATSLSPRMPLPIDRKKLPSTRPITRTASRAVRRARPIGTDDIRGGGSTQILFVTGQAVSHCRSDEALRQALSVWWRDSSAARSRRRNGCGIAGRADRGWERPRPQSRPCMVADCGELLFVQGLRHHSRGDVRKAENPAWPSLRDGPVHDEIQ